MRKRRRCGHCGIFQSTPSAWRETYNMPTQRAMEIFQSTPSAWRETSAHCRRAICAAISIHSLRMEGDCPNAYHSTSEITISIHSLRMEGDYLLGRVENDNAEFQSTPSAWRETMGHQRGLAIHPFQSTPSAWRETRLYLRLEVFQIFQSTPSAWRETERNGCATIPLNQFQSTPSAWRETAVVQTCGYTPSDFNPLPPHGGRLWLTVALVTPRSFQSTPSAWRETCLQW